MDRSWIHARQFTPAFLDGVKDFMQFIRAQFNENDEILCPCRRCLNQRRRAQSTVEDHLYINGISSTYSRWVHHGEAFDVEVFEDPNDVNENASCMGHAAMDVNDMDEDDDRDEPIPELLGDLYTAAEAEGSHPKFSSVIQDAKKALYPGCPNFSRFSFFVKLLHIKSYHRMSNTGFSAMMKLLSLAFPHCELPSSYNEAKNYLRELGLGYDSIHVCTNNCVLFWKDYANLDACPVCGESRWKDSDGKMRVAQKVLRHFQLIPRLKRMFASKKTAEDTQWHKLKREPVEGEMSHPADGEAWKDFDGKYPDFAEDARNLRLGVSTDGFNPFGNMSTSYSMWPVIVVPYNLPPWACMDQSNFMMTLLIPGPKSPGKDFDLFLEPLIEELLQLWIGGVHTYDALTSELFYLKAAILWCIHDYPALRALSGRTTSGYFACVHCDKNPLSKALRGKICYIGHRRYLPKNHPWRRSLDFDGHIETRDKPGKFSKDELLEQVEKVKNVRPGKHPQPQVKKRKREENDGPAFNRRVSFFDLPYWADLKLRHNLDVMHIEKNICDNLVGTLLGIVGKTKDTINARLDLEDMDIREELHLEDRGSSYGVPPACYTLTKEIKIAFCEFLRNVRFPEGYASNLARCVVVDGCKVQGLKTHDCHILLQRILPAGMRGFVRQDIYEAIAELENFFRELCSKTVKVDVLRRLQADVPKILCKLERIFPPAFFDVMVHLTVHLPEEAMLRGPVQYGWMFPIERRLGSLKHFLRNRARPEGSIAEAYIADEALTFCSRYMDDVDTRFNREGRSGDVDASAGDLRVFKHGVTLQGASRMTCVKKDQLDAMVWYVLNNCEEVEPYIKLRRAELEIEGAHDVEKRLQKGFQEWFQNYIARLRSEKPEEVSEDLYALSCGPDVRVCMFQACTINGICFNTVEREKNRKTQNSGIMTEGTHRNVFTEFYGALKEIIELRYESNLQVRRSVVLYRCDWFDLEGKKTGIRDDGYFKSINIERCWYKSEPFILSSQAKKIFYLQDTKLGKNWRVVQKFEHRQMYNVAERNSSMPSAPNQDAYQEDNCSDTELELQDIHEPMQSLHRPAGEGCSVNASVVNRLKSDLLVEASDSDYEDDDTWQQYCSDNEHADIPIGRERDNDE